MARVADVRPVGCLAQLVVGTTGTESGFFLFFDQNEKLKLIYCAAVWGLLCPPPENDTNSRRADFGCFGSREELPQTNLFQLRLPRQLNYQPRRNRMGVCTWFGGRWFVDLLSPPQLSPPAMAVSRLSPSRV